MLCILEIDHFQGQIKDEQIYFMIIGRLTRTKIEEQDNSFLIQISLLSCFLFWKYDEEEDTKIFKMEKNLSKKEFLIKIYDYFKFKGFS